MTRSFLLSLAVVALAGCSGVFGSEPEVASVISIAPSSQAYNVEPGAEGFDFDVPPEAEGPRWAQMGGNTEHLPGNPALKPVPEKAWSEDIGAGSSSDGKLLAVPLIVDGVVYAQDTQGYVSAYKLADGDRLWRVTTAPQGRDVEAMGGGLAWEKNILYVTTGIGDVLALRAVDGAVLWRRPLGKPLRSAPTVSDGRVFVITVENETYVLEAETGRSIWRHSGIAEAAALLGSSSPAVQGDTVVIPYSSGEVFALRTQNGRLSWSEVLAVPRHTGALPAIADIKGLPVLDGKTVFAISHSGRFAALDLRTGGRVWDRDIGGINTPSVVGRAVFVVTNDDHLVALSREDGRILWASALAARQDPSDDESKAVTWFGPVMAGGQLWVTSSVGVLAAFNPQDGALLHQQKLAGAFFLPPVVAQNTMILLSDDGDLIALR